MQCNVLFDRITEQIDDVVDAIPVHLGCGIWGVLAAGLFATKDNCECCTTSLARVPTTMPPLEALLGVGCQSFRVA